MHGQGAHLDLYAASSIERHTHNLYLDQSRRSGTSQQALLDRHFCPRTATPRIPDLRRPVHAFLAPSRSDTTDIATASRIIGGAVDEITIRHTLGRPHAPEAGFCEKSSNGAAAVIDLYVSSGHQQQLFTPALSKQHKQQPSSPLLTPQARLGYISRTRRLPVGCTSNIYETLLSELRSSIRGRRSGRVPP
jgi:hypothetical protein